MAPSFLSLKQFRRRSRASFRTEKSTDDSNSSEGSHSNATSGSLTPPSLGQQSDPALNLQLRNGSSAPPVPSLPSVPSRPKLLTSLSSASSLRNGGGSNASSPPTPSQSKRYSVPGMAGLGSPVVANGPSRLPVSPYSPRIHSVNDNSWVYQKVLIVHGTVGDPAAQQPVEGTVTVSRLDDGFPPVQWPVCASHFKALVYLLPGPNKLRFDFSSPKLPNYGTSNPIHASYLTLHMLPPTDAPPLQLAILLGSDSPGTYDAVPARVEREGNNLETAIRKFRMAAYLWQGFTAEQMWRNRFGRRVFRFDEEWTQGTSNYRDRETGQMRSEARIHIIRSSKTRAELRDLDRAQQNEKAKDRGAQFSIAMDDVRNYFNPQPGQTLYVSVLLLDAHWDPKAKMITGHAALGGGNNGGIRLAVFGSHCLQSYPSSFEEVIPAFSDCTPTDTNFCANDCNDAGSSWEAANIGIGAHMHETGHLLDLPHRENGVMLRDYVTLNRSFMAREAYSTRTKSKGGIVLEKDECTWHRLDCLRFRSHPCFRLPNDPPAAPDESLQAWPVEGGNVAFTAASGVAYLEIFANGDDVCRAWMEYPLDNSGNGNGTIQRQLVLTEQDIRNRLPDGKRKKDPIRVVAHSWGGGSLDIKDIRELWSKDASTRLTGNVLLGKSAFRSKKVGSGQMDGSRPEEFLFSSATQTGRVMSKVIFYHGKGVDGLEFVYEDNSRQLFGKRGGKPGGDTFDLDVRRGEYISGFFVRSGFWIDGIQILTSSGRRSPIYGNATGGSPNTLVPPRGYTICGVTGSCGAWVDSFAVLIAK